MRFLFTEEKHTTPINQTIWSLQQIVSEVNSIERRWNPDRFVFREETMQIEENAVNDYLMHALSLTVSPFQIFQSLVGKYPVPVDEFI